MLTANPLEAIELPLSETERGNIAANGEARFIKNKYYHWYMKICTGWPCAKDRPNDYVERHHILPRCMGGLNGKDNIAILSFRKHFLAHWLLTKCTMMPDRVKLLAALAGMCRTLKNGRKIVSGWQFAIARLALAERTRALHADPEFAARRDARLRAMHADPEFAAKLVERMRASARARNADPKFAARSAEKLRAMHADPEYSARHSANMRVRMRKMNIARTPEQRSKASHKGQAARTLEQRVEWAHKVQMALTHDQRSEIAYKNNAARTPEQRSEAIRKGHATRAARRAAALQSEASLFCERIAPKAMLEVIRKG